ncbi:MAG: 50S ribosomal protein L3 [Patescibacteria group bacterium]|nr:50S ribosomal protein L3 [Patescibacteria group bacterium]
MFILGKKIKTDQVWQEKKIVSVTVVRAMPNTVSLVRTAERDGYHAVQLAMGKEKKEFKVKESALKMGDSVGVDGFKEGDTVRVSGTTKGRGYQGVVKRHGFGGGPKTHGQKNRLRMPGSIGNTSPQRVLPGKKMAGHMGTDRVTIKNLKIVSVDKDNNLLFIKGAVPGARDGVVEIVKINT